MREEEKLLKLLKDIYQTNISDISEDNTTFRLFDREWEIICHNGQLSTQLSNNEDSKQNIIIEANSEQTWEQMVHQHFASLETKVTGEPELSYSNCKLIYSTNRLPEQTTDIIIGELLTHKLSVKSYNQHQELPLIEVSTTILGELLNLKIYPTAIIVGENKFSNAVQIENANGFNLLDNNQQQIENFTASLKSVLDSIEKRIRPLPAGTKLYVDIEEVASDMPFEVKQVITEDDQYQYIVEVTRHTTEQYRKIQISEDQIKSIEELGTGSYRQEQTVDIKADSKQLLTGFLKVIIFIMGMVPGIICISHELHLLALIILLITTVSLVPLSKNKYLSYYLPFWVGIFATTFRFGYLTWGVLINAIIGFIIAYSISFYTQKKETK